MVFPSAASRSGATHSFVAPRQGLPGPRRSHPRRRSPCPTTVMVGTPGSSTPPALSATLTPAAPRRELVFSRGRSLYYTRGGLHCSTRQLGFDTTAPAATPTRPVRLSTHNSFSRRDLRRRRKGLTPAGNRPCLRSCQDSGKHVSDLTAGVIRVGGVRDHIIGHLPLRV